MKKTKKIRIDHLLVAQGLAADIKAAQALIMAGAIIVGEQRVENSSERFDPTLPITIRSRGRFVSRGGDKLADAIRILGIEHEFSAKRILDIGASTGGFTDLMLASGAAQVVAVEVGTNQLAWKLRQDPRVIALEKTDIRHFDRAPYGPFDWIIADISFNSLARLAEPIWAAGSTGSRYLLLVKPQFELPADEVPQGGVVSDPDARERAVISAITALEQVGFTLLGRADLTISGRKGNWEVMLYLIKR